MWCVELNETIHFHSYSFICYVFFSMLAHWEIDREKDKGISAIWWRLTFIVQCSTESFHDRKKNSVRHPKCINYIPRSIRNIISSLIMLYAHQIVDKIVCVCVFLFNANFYYLRNTEFILAMHWILFLHLNKVGWYSVYIYIFTRFGRTQWLCELWSWNIWHYVNRIL